MLSCHLVNSTIWHRVARKHQSNSIVFLYICTYLGFCYGLYGPFRFNLYNSIDISFAYARCNAAAHPPHILCKVAYGAHAMSICGLLRRRPEKKISNTDLLSIYRKQIIVNDLQSYTATKLNVLRVQYIAIITYIFQQWCIYAKRLTIGRILTTSAFWDSSCMTMHRECMSRQRHTINPHDT